jgi:hypothetical protein
MYDQGKRKVGWCWKVKVGELGCCVDDRQKEEHHCTLLPSWMNWQTSILISSVTTVRGFRRRVRYWEPRTLRTCPPRRKKFPELPVPARPEGKIFPVPIPKKSSPYFPTIHNQLDCISFLCECVQFFGFRMTMSERKHSPNRPAPKEKIPVHPVPSAPNNPPRGNTTSQWNSEYEEGTKFTFSHLRYMVECKCYLRCFSASTFILESCGQHWKIMTFCLT